MALPSALSRLKTSPVKVLSAKFHWRQYQGTYCVEKFSFELQPSLGRFMA
ncbi:hypothetical protein H4J51_04385 [Colwellia sp. MB02u-18]|nr:MULTISPECIES: hypothetical protein [unclassified Colwellia]MBA6223621.1 hypothetical protein [Colwellia sp. MB3u-45]MBA6267313.1 hypothetical protein [Colwellia sp. MB3u-43]MBA6319802.1 hypothetical protein [Colwellia sp. MB02u-19]MBA6323819.1 hypothetical protein [Colwellia sp. MB02u-18]MBA6330809.1 hypothetical protein [Colwellia sp. MB02u-12]